MSYQQTQQYGQMPQQTQQTQQYGQMPQQSYQAPQAQYGQMPQPGYQAPQVQQPKKSTFVQCIKDNYTTISLFEFSAGYDPSEEFPQAFAFVMGVPSVPDQTKQSGKRYVPDNKIVMKFSTQELRSMGQTLLDIAIFKGAAQEFNKFTDPSKNSFAQANAQAGATKSIKVSYDQNKNNVIINISYGQQKVFIPIKDLLDAKGLGWSLINAGNFADNKLAEYLMANNIRTNVPDEVPSHVIEQNNESNMQPQTQPQVQPQYGQMPQTQPQYGQMPQTQPQTQPQGVPTNIQYQG